MAFFPCVMFENQKYLWFQGNSSSQKNWDAKMKLEYNLKEHKALSEFYEVITKLALICMDRNLKCVLENPYSKEHYLYRYWSLRPEWIDTDRTKRGDYFTKPTQFYFINTNPKNNLIWECIEDNSLMSLDKMNTRADFEQTGAANLRVARSMIHPQYANRFIREFIL